jgi:tRNA A37 threonylcarbamoyladenosine dehydratase
MKTVYEGAKETAKKIRKELKKEFPRVKFSVTSKEYSMGSSVYVSKKEGRATKAEVEAVVEKFKSSTFDGMEDYKNSHGYIYEGVKYIGADYILVG